jgi:hypothetical protein
MAKACYRELRKHKYQLMDDDVLRIDIYPERDIEYLFVSLSSGGRLTIRKAYAWDGPSTPSEWLGSFRNPSLTFGALIGTANVRERSSSDARFLAVGALVAQQSIRGILCAATWCMMRCIS